MLNSFNDTQGEVEEIRTLTREEAAVVKAKNPPLNPWKVVGWQIVVMVLVALAALAISRKTHVFLSVLWGGACVVIPAGLFARGLMSRTTLANAGTAVVGFLVWELVKIGSTIALLFVAAKLIDNLSWPAMLVGLVVTMQVYWLALLFKPKAKISAQ